MPVEPVVSGGGDSWLVGAQGGGLVLVPVGGVVVVGVGGVVVVGVVGGAGLEPSVGRQLGVVLAGGVGVPDAGVPGGEVSVVDPVLDVVDGMLVVDGGGADEVAGAGAGGAAGGASGGGAGSAGGVGTPTGTLLSGRGNTPLR